MKDLHSILVRIFEVVAITDWKFAKIYPRECTRSTARLCGGRAGDSAWLRDDPVKRVSDLYLQEVVITFNTSYTMW